MSAAEMYARTTSGGVWTDIDKHLPFLRESAKGNVLEIGTRGGVSTAALLVGVAEHGGHVWSVDIADCSGLYRDDPNWTFIQSDSRDTAKVKAIIPAELDVLFIDGDHSYAGCMADLQNYAPMVKPGGVILLHDTDLIVSPQEGVSVKRAVDDYCQQAGIQPTFIAGAYGLGVLKP